MELCASKIYQTSIRIKKSTLNEILINGQKWPSCKTEWTCNLSSGGFAVQLPPVETEKNRGDGS